MEKILEFNYPSSQIAWEKINEYFLNNSEYIVNKMGGSNNSNTLSIPNAIIYVEKLKVKPTFDFCKTFNYAPQKWNLLISNYINRDELLDFKERITKSQKKSTYNESFIFSNSHLHGKGCLLSLTISKRSVKNKDREDNERYKIYITLHMRSTEVTKRLLMDFLLVERLAYFIFGKEEKNISLVLHTCNLYQDIISLTMYDVYKPLEESIYLDSSWSRSATKFLKKFKNESIEKQPRKVYKRSMKVLQNKGLEGNLLAKELKL